MDQTWGTFTAEELLYSFPVVTPPEPVRDLPRTETQNPAHKSGDRLVQSTGGHPPLFALNQAESNLRILIFFNKI